MQLVLWPNPLLKQKSEPLKEAPSAELLEAMFTTMKDNHGVGLSAIQLGVPQRLVTMSIDKQQWVLVNPVIVDRSSEKLSCMEGCLSLPGFHERVVRNSWIVVEFLDKEMKPQRVKFDGLHAQCVQHEVEHLDGIVFVDHLPAPRRSGILGNVMALKKKGLWKTKKPVDTTEEKK